MAETDERPVTANLRMMRQLQGTARAQQLREEGPPPLAGFMEGFAGEEQPPGSVTDPNAKTRRTWFEAGKAANVAKTGIDALTGLGAVKGTLLAAAPLARKLAGDEAKAAVTTLRKQAPAAPAVQTSMGPVTVLSPERLLNPGIYKRPQDIIEDLRKQAVPESPNLKRLWGETRESLADAASVPGNVTDPRVIIPGYPQKPKGTAHMERMMTPQNADRLVETLAAARRDVPEVWTGMKGWYPQHPIYKRLLELTDGNEQEALMRFARLNRFGASESPMTSPLIEMRRGAGANFMHEQGPAAFEEFLRYGGLGAKERAHFGIMPELGTVPGRIGFNANVGPKQASIVDRPDVVTGSRKTNPYELAGSIPELGPRFGRQTDVAIGDTHHAGSTGTSDVRPATAGGPRGSFSTPETIEHTPWYKENVADPLGVTPVQAQGIQWGVYGPQTGVKAPIGAPKLEMLSDLIAKRAGTRLDSPENIRDKVLMGKEHLGFSTPKTLATILGIGSPLAYYLRNRKKDEAEPPSKLRKFEAQNKDRIDAALEKIDRTAPVTEAETK